MSNGAATDFGPAFVSGEADYFSAILAMQNASQQSSTLPEALLDLAQAIKIALLGEGLSWTGQKPVLLTAAELSGFGALSNLIVLRHQLDGKQLVIAASPPALICLATLLLGNMPALQNRAATGVEARIALQFLQYAFPLFQLAENPQTSLIWQDYAGAKLAFSDAPDSAFVVLMMNRRFENVKPEANLADSGQQNYVRQAIGNGVLNVDYVLDGGEVSLAMLRNLAVGSVLPLASLKQCALEARANGKVMFSGALDLTQNEMRFGVTRILEGGLND